MMMGKEEKVERKKEKLKRMRVQVTSQVMMMMTGHLDFHLLWVRFVDHHYHSLGYQRVKVLLRQLLDSVLLLPFLLLKVIEL